MSTNPESAGSAADPILIEDLFLTDAFLIKGRLPNKSMRLSNALEENERAFLAIEDATMVSLRSAEVIRTPRVLVNCHEVIFAHELLEIGGDDVLRKLAEPNKAVRIRAFYSGTVQLELAGQVEPGAYEAGHGAGRKYFIMQTPRLRGIDLRANEELRVLQGLEYAIVRKDKLSYVYDFS